MVILLVPQIFTRPEVVLPHLIQSLIVKIVSITAHLAEHGVFSLTQPANAAGDRPINYSHLEFFGDEESITRRSDKFCLT